MKLLISFVFLLSSSAVVSQNSGWFMQSAGINANLYSVHFENGLTGWISGSGGVILKTINGGNNWLQQSSGTNSALRTIFFTSLSTGWAAGDNGIILKTTNGGSSWFLQPGGITASIRSLWFSNSNTGYLAGASGKISKTTNGGSSWTPQTSGISTDINSIMFVDINTGWASGNSGKILKTTNAGSSWSINIDHGPVSNFYGVTFPDNSRGTAIGRYVDAMGNNFVYFYKTDNGGLWWEYQYSGSTKILKSVFFTDSLNGWAAGDSGVVFGTTNKGISWIEQTSRTFNNLNSVFFVDKNVGYAVGNNSTIIKTTHAGYKDIIPTNRRDLGVAPIVENVFQLINAKYRVQFKSPDTTYSILRSLNNGVTFDTLFNNLNLLDTGRLFDGLSLKVKKIKFISANPSGNYSGNVGVVKDPTLPVDSIQTRLYGWDYFPAQNKYLEGSFYKPSGKNWQSQSMGISYPNRNTYIGFRSQLNPEDLRKVKLVFKGYSNGQTAYRYLSVSVVSYQYQDMREVPFKVYEIDETDGTSQPRQLNCAFLEFPGPAQDNKWEPTSDSLGGKEILYIFNSNYSPVPDSAYISKNLYLQQPAIDVMYAWGPKKINPNSNFTINDEFYIYPYTVTRPEIAPGYPLYYEFVTNSVIGIQPISEIIPGKFSLMQNYPNPFNPVTKIRFQIPLLRGVDAAGGRGVSVKLTIYDILGREITTLVNEQLRPGTYEAEWNGLNYSTGVYFYKLQADGYSESKKMVMIK